MADAGYVGRLSHAAVKQVPGVAVVSEQVTGCVTVVRRQLAIHQDCSIDSSKYPMYQSALEFHLDIRVSPCGILIGGAVMLSSTSVDTGSEFN